MTHVWRPSDLLAADFGTTQFYIEPISAPGSVLVVFGPREAGKTQLFFSMIRAMHDSALLLGRYRCRPARVALIEVDMTVVTTQERLRKAATEHLFSDDLLRIATPPAINVFTVSPTTMWVKTVQAFAPDVVAFDSLRKIHPADENDPGVPSQLYSRCKILFPGSAFWFAHHVKKPPPTWLQEKHKYDPGEDPNVYRGTTAWLDDADAAIYLHREPKGEKRSFRLVRARYAPDELKHEVIGVSLRKGSMFLEVGELSERQWVLHWRMAHPTVTLHEVVTAAEGQYPGRSKPTYYSWAHAAEQQAML